MNGPAVDGVELVAATFVGDVLAGDAAAGIEEPDDDAGEARLAGVLHAVAIGVDPDEVADRGAGGVVVGSASSGSDVAGSEDAVGSDVAASVAAPTSWDRSVAASRYSFPPIVITVVPPTMRTWLEHPLGIGRRRRGHPVAVGGGELELRR